VEQKDFNVNSFNAFMAEGKLMASKCKKCNTTYLPPRPLCSKCQEAAMEWAQLSGKGTIAAYTAIAVAPTVMVNQGLGKNNPYCTGVVKLAEGPQISARIIGVDAKKPESIKVGTPVTLSILERTEGANKAYMLGFKAE